MVEIRKYGGINIAKNRQKILGKGDKKAVNLKATLIIIFQILATTVAILIPVSSAQRPENITILGWMVLEPNVKVGDLLTSMAILISLISIYIALLKDHRLRQKEQADRVRNAAAKTIANLIQWREISLSAFQDLDLLIAKIFKEHDTSNGPDELESRLVTNLKEQKNETCKRVLDESNSIKYGDIYDYDPLAGIFFNKALAYLLNEQSIMFEGLLSGAKDVIKNKEDMETRLNEHIQYIKSIYETRLNDAILTKIGDHLLSLISDKDKNILKTRKIYFDLSSMKLQDQNPTLYMTYSKPNIIYPPGYSSPLGSS